MHGQKNIKSKMVSKRRPLKLDFTLGNRKYSAGAKPEEKGGDKEK